MMGESELSDSDFSMNYEELDDGSEVQCVLVIRQLDEDKSSSDGAFQDESDESYDDASSNSGSDNSNASQNHREDQEIEEQIFQAPDLIAELQVELLIQAQKEESQNDLRWRLMELEEQKRTIADQILETQDAIANAQEECRVGEETRNANLEISVISKALLEEYESLL